jgi:acyl carrier protein
MDVHSRLESVFRDVFDDDSLKIDASMCADDVEAWDSLAHINLMMRIEEVFGVHFTNAELGGFANVGELERFLIERAAL